MERPVGHKINIKNTNVQNVEENAVSVSVKLGRPLYIYIANVKTKKNALKMACYAMLC